MTMPTRAPVSRYWEAWEQQFLTLGAMRRIVSDEENPHFKALLGLWNTNAEDAASSAAILIQELGLADTFFWARPMLDVIEVAAKTIPDYTFDPTRLPSPAGWFWLERPLPFTEVGQQADLNDVSKGSISSPEGWNLVRAISWGCYTTRPMKDRVELTFTEPGQMPDHIAIGVWQKSPDVPYLVPVLHQIIEAGKNMSDTIARYAEIRKTAVDYFPGEEIPHAEKMRIAATMFAFLDQRVFTTHHRESLPRHLRRRIEQEAEWQNLKRQRQDVRIVYLRRFEPAKTAEEHEVVAWRCRWMVRGHWRQQPYGPKDAPTEIRPKWIAPFIKGPVGKPFKTPGKDLFSIIR